MAQFELAKMLVIGLGASTILLFITLIATIICCKRKMKRVTAVADLQAATAATLPTETIGEVDINNRAQLDEMHLEL